MRQLNNDIWHPFRLAYSKLDAPAFLAVHAPELIRAGGPAKQVFGFVERICVDYDTDERSATLEEEFLAAIDVDDVDAFTA